MFSNAWRHFLVVPTGGGVTLASSDQRLGILLNILHCIGQPHQKSIEPRMLIVVMFRNPGTHILTGPAHVQNIGFGV